MTTAAKLFFSLMFLAVIFLWAMFPTLVSSMVGSDLQGQWAVRGLFGDSFGVLNSLFTALAFCGVMANLYLQSAQMRLLESREAGIEAAQKQQVRLMAVSAALNHYTVEAGRLQDIAFNIMARQAESGDADDAKTEWDLAMDENRASRDSLLMELQVLMEETS
jgi:hypothetical protein